MSKNQGAMPSKEELMEAFPEVDSGIIPFGSRVLVQIRTAKTRSIGGIIIPEDTRETEKWNTQIAKVIAMGPLAFRNRDSMKPWAEGEWCAVGDFIRAPKYGGDRWDVPVPDKHDALAQFVIFNDLDLVGKVTGNPLSVKAFI